jgi:dihydroorotate dehydrogenase
MVSSWLEPNQIEPAAARRLAADYERFSSGVPGRLEQYVREHYALDLSSEYGGHPIRNPFGKASGQLSLSISQVKRDASAGLGFVVLKTVIAEDETGARAMSDWASAESRMVLERIRGTRPSVRGVEGRTVTWKGRGWHRSFQEYLKLFGDSLDFATGKRWLAVPSVKFHLPAPGEKHWKLGEYEHTTGRLLEIWRRRRGETPMPLEKNFSPTLAGSGRAAAAEKVLEWLARAAGFVRAGAKGLPIAVGVKVFNALFDDEFQIEMLRVLSECRSAGRADFLVYANRLFDPEREFDGVRGIAFGGPDLSDRNLGVLARYRWLEQRGQAPPLDFPISATGDIHSGRQAAEYMLRGASSFQMHTFFQLPPGEYRMKRGGKSERALHELLFHPRRGFIASVLALRKRFGWPPEWNVKQMADFCAHPANRLWAHYDRPAPGPGTGASER